MQFFDVLFFDSVGMPYVGESCALGGTEQQTIRVAEGLAAAGKRVGVLNRTSESGTVNGVFYGPLSTRAEMDTLVILRTSQVSRSPARRTIVWAHDVGPQQLSAGELVCVSKWQLSTYGREGTVIMPMLPAIQVIHTPVRGRFIYASAACKGLDVTLEMWSALPVKKTHLLVTNPGYDWDRVPKKLPENVTYLGVLPSISHVMEVMATCEGLFYVNTFPETAGVTPALAEAIGLRAHVLSANPCGLTEMVTGGYLTSDPDQFARDFVHPKKYPPPTKKYGTIEQWLELLR